MKWIAPDMYPDFTCLADQCRHSCCVGWEIEIDPATLARYRTVKGALGDRLKAGVEEDQDGARFRLDPAERCPFLNERNLCDLILAGAPLCQICTDHPRFRNFFADRTEIGLGLCCEAAARLTLQKTEPMRLMVLRDDGADEKPDEDEQRLLTLRAEDVALLQRRSMPLSKRIDAMLARRGIALPRRTLSQWAAIYLSLERLDEAWTKWLEALAKADDNPELPEGALDTPLEQLMVYLLYRHLPGALEDGDYGGRLAFAALSVQLLRGLLAAKREESTPDDLVELARLYSSEIEYSDENLAALLDALHEETT
ncbi:MAG: flagellin lysine-N-methylase [Eubacteriales bacterium]|nr:flagellin lysine-N-methylase [Eubacteriales bacterium]